MNHSQNNTPGEGYFRQEFTRLISRPEEDLDLGLAALLVAGEEYPELDVEGHLRLLDGFAMAVRNLAPDDMPAVDRAKEVGRYLFRELGFHGNSADYYNPDNSYFNRVLETQTGIPITLSLLFLEVARRIGLRCRGVGMPGHFLVGLEGEEVYFDPFNGGSALSSDDCRRLAERLFGERLAWSEGYLTPCTKYEFLFRMLNNLKVVYERTDATEKALGIVQRMIMVSPEATALHQDLASLHYQLQQYRAAISSLEEYLRLAKDAPDAAQVKTWIESIRTTLNRLN
jgi:regulator of sirC expression with transglutaminase-like and TPR domain